MNEWQYRVLRTARSAPDGGTMEVLKLIEVQYGQDGAIAAWRRCSLVDLDARSAAAIEALKQEKLEPADLE